MCQLRPGYVTRSVIRRPIVNEQLLPCIDVPAGNEQQVRSILTVFHTHVCPNGFQLIRSTHGPASRNSSGPTPAATASTSGSNAHVAWGKGPKEVVCVLVWGAV